MRRLLRPPPFPEFDIETEDGSAPFVEIPVKSIPSELGTEMALGFMAHKGENRTTRRAAVANWTPPEVPKDGERPPSRRELWEQRKKHRRGKLDVELRRLGKLKKGERK